MVRRAILEKLNPAQIISLRFVSPLLLFRDMVSSVENFLVEYDYKIFLSVDQSSASEDEKGVKAGSGGWEIVILEVSFKIDSGLTLTFRAPQLQEITINLCKMCCYLF